jgi:hypothetical protein
MTTEGAKERWEEMSSNPFQPDMTINEPGQRTANAIEYIAGQLGQINAKLERLLPKSEP